MLHVMWRAYDWLNNGYSFYMAAVIVLGGECGLRIEACPGKQSNKSRPLLYSHYCHFNVLFKQLYTNCKDRALQYKDVCEIRGRTCIKVFQRELA